MTEETTGSSGLFDKYLAENRIFKDREVLRHSYRPHILPHRKPQIDQIASILAPSLQMETPSNILIYGKTGTGRVNGQDINGWFIGFIESQNNTYFFSTNIQSEQRATGSKASDGALSTRIDSSHKYKHLPTLQELTYTPILAVFQKSLLTAIPPQHTV